MHRGEQHRAVLLIPLLSISGPAVRLREALERVSINLVDNIIFRDDNKLKFTLIFLFLSLVLKSCTNLQNNHVTKQIGYLMIWSKLGVVLIKGPSVTLASLSTDLEGSDALYLPEIDFACERFVEEKEN